MHTPLFRAFRRALALALPPGASTSGLAARRRVIAGFAAGAASTLLPVPAAAAAPRVAVVGGGLAGLVAAHHLRRAGVAVTLYEARGSVGGRVRSAEALGMPGLVQDLGGHFINSDHDDMIGLAREFGLPLVDRGAELAAGGEQALAFLFGGRRIPMAEMAAALGPFAQRLAADAADIEGSEEVSAEYDQLSVAEYLARNARLLNPLARGLLEASIRSEYGVEPAESSMLQLVFNLPTVSDGRAEPLGASDEAFVLQAGAASLPAALAESLGAVIRTGEVLTEVRRRGGGYTLGFESGRAIEADIVLLALPFPVLRAVRLDIGAPADFSRLLRDARLGRNEKLFAGFRGQPWRGEGGFAGSLWSDAGFACAWEASAVRGDGALSFLAGGREVDALGERSGPRFLRVLERGGMAAVARAANGRFARTGWSADPFTRGSYSSFAPGQLTAFAPWFWTEDEDGRPTRQARVGQVFFAGEQLSADHYGFMNGAAQTGRLAAAAILSGCCS